MSGWVERSARWGYTAKGFVYAVVGGLAVQQAIGSGGETSGARGALREIASQPFGQILLGIVTLGLAGYVLWRLTQALVDPESDQSDDGIVMRVAKRMFYFSSAVIYGLLTYYGATLALGSGGENGGSGGGGDSSTWIADVMSMSWGVWLVGALGIGIIGRGLLQFWKAYTESFKEKLGSFQLRSKTRAWILRVSRVGLTARGVVFGLIGFSILNAAATHDPEQVRGTEGVLNFLVSHPWLLAAVGVGFVCYAGYQWVKAKYRLIAA